MRKRPQVSIMSSCRSNGKFGCLSISEIPFPPHKTSSTKQSCISCLLVWLESTRPKMEVKSPIEEQPWTNQATQPPPAAVRQSGQYGLASKWRNPQHAWLRRKDQMLTIHIHIYIYLRKPVGTYCIIHIYIYIYTLY